MNWYKRWKQKVMSVVYIRWREFEHSESLWTVYWQGTQTNTLDVSDKGCQTEDSMFQDVGQDVSRSEIDWSQEISHVYIHIE